MAGVTRNTPHADRAPDEPDDPHLPDAQATPEDERPMVIVGTVEQREKNQAALAWLKRRREEYEALSPAEKDELEREWEVYDLIRRENPIQLTTRSW